MRFYCLSDATWSKAVFHKWGDREGRDLFCVPEHRVAGQTQTVTPGLPLLYLPPPRLWLTIRIRLGQEQCSVKLADRSCQHLS